MSKLKNTTIPLGNKLIITKLQLPTTSGGSTYGYGSAGQILKSNGTTVYWANPVDTALPSTSLSDYYTPPASSSDYVTYDGNGITFSNSLVTGNETTGGIGILFNDSVSGTAGRFFKAFPINRADTYISCSVAAGGKLWINAVLTPTTNMMVNGTSIYACSYTSLTGPKIVISESSDSQTSFSTNLYKSTSMAVPIQTSATSTMTTSTDLTWTNTASTSKTVYIHAIQETIQGIIYGIRMTSGGSFVTSGTLIYPMRMTVKVKSESSETYPTGTTFNRYGINGYVLVRSNGNVTASLPDTFFVKRGDFCFKISSSGLQKSTNKGTSWTTM